MRSISANLTLVNRRLFIAEQLVTERPFLFLDEPTTGLSAGDALEIMKLLRVLATDHGHAVVVSIHQPRPRIYALFDELLLVHHGKLAYAGSPSAEALTSYFTGALRLTLPLKTRFIGDAVTDVLASMPELPSFSAEGVLSPRDIPPVPPNDEWCDWTTELGVHLKAAWRLEWRSKRFFITELGPSVVLALLIGFGWLNMGQRNTAEYLRLFPYTVGLLAVLTAFRNTAEAMAYGGETAIALERMQKNTTRLLPWLVVFFGSQCARIVITALICVALIYALAWRPLDVFAAPALL